MEEGGPNLKENIHEGHRERLKNQFLSDKIAEDVLPAKLLEMLLFYGIPQKDTSKLALDLIESFGSFSGVLEADIDELVKVKGMTRNAATLIKLMRPVGREYVLSKYHKKEVLKTPKEIGDFVLAQYFGLNGENFSLLCINRLGKVISFEVIMRGSVDSVGVSPRLVIEKVLKHEATSVVIAHNHPGGIAIPSHADVEITKQLAVLLKGISVNLVDHIIIADDDYVSMASSNQYNEIFK